MHLSVQNFYSTWNMFADAHVDGFSAMQPRAATDLTIVDEAFKRMQACLVIGTSRSFSDRATAEMLEPYLNREMENRDGGGRTIVLIKVIGGAAPSAARARVARRDLRPEDLHRFKPSRAKH
ncbi:hypothetical protein EVAR_75842_1 [Eumeta japonica]|uniref:Uncharacterized protein n=1 Tax=Eumeta variegata TaxID=151549 RepID=A0A4C1TGK0_EUMVA|nr:hypothetical protein EVAR_75842_1 [Eumeta japonica]